MEEERRNGIEGRRERLQRQEVEGEEWEGKEEGNEEPGANV